MTTEFRKILERENLKFDNAIVTEEDGHKTTDIVEAAWKIHRSVRVLSESRGHADFVLAITKKDGLPIKTTQIGNVEKLEHSLVMANLNASVLIANPNAISSNEVLHSPEGVGAISVEDWIISIHGFENPKMNQAVALGIAFGAKLITYEVAEHLAHDPRINCVVEYMEHEDALTGPFFNDIPTSRTF